MPGFIKKIASAIGSYRYKAEMKYIVTCWALTNIPLYAFGFILIFYINQPVFLRLFLLILIVLFINSVCSVFLVFWNVILPINQKLSDIRDKYLPASDSAGQIRMVDTLTDLDKHLGSFKEREVSAMLLQKQAELDSLQSQINPHFLYNTLDSIRGQALEDGSVQASDMIEALSTLLRYTISQRGDMVTLGQELKSVDNYIKIQQYRFNNRFGYEKSIEDFNDGLLSAKIPKLTLQPLIENAIYHGVDSLSTQGMIKIEIFNTQSRLVIIVSDNGVGMEEEQLKELRQKLKNYIYEPEKTTESRSTGIAITNVNSRIKLAFGDEFGITVFSKKNMGTKFQISIPFKRQAVKSQAK